MIDDVAVVGGGPAAWAAAGACARAGCRVRLLTTDPEPVWPATYGLWADQLDGLGLGQPWSHRWETATVVTTAARSLPVPYVRLDNAALAAALASAAAGVTIERTRVLAVDPPGPPGSTSGVQTLRRTEGGPVTARLVVVAAGSGSALVGRTRPPRTAQLAWGCTVPAEDAPAVDPAGCVFMDWSAPVGERRAPQGGPPSFLYAQGLGDGRVFVEETVLATSDVRADLARLRARLAGRGIRLDRAEHLEQVRIPLGRGPVRPRHVVAFGAAGGYVHPATGYSLARSLRAAPVLARAVVEALEGPGPLQARVAACHEALWPAAQRQADALLRYGGAVACRLDQARATELFDALFALPVPAWRAYVDHTGGPARLAAVMTRVFAAAGVRLRLALASAGRLG
ncbi:MAG: lycopene cyclase family protein [Acidimicrobiales bacterium]